MPEIRLTVEGPGGADTATRRIRLLPPPPEAIITLPVEGADRAVEQVWGFVAATESQPEIPFASYFWDFGDGQTGAGATTTHLYARTFVAAPDFSRNVTIRLTVVGPGGTATATRTIRVYDPSFSTGALRPARQEPR
jgi:hypothetical protein